MTTHKFFEGLRDRGHEPLFANATATMRFDIDDDRFYVTIDKGTVSVRNRGPKATCTVRCTRELFDQIADGRRNATAAALRGDIEIEGDPGVLLLFQRMLPGPQSSTHPRAEA